ncbi:MAG: hypothetical protein Q7T97_15390 [Burkholderiaceae bacterium]|nr:hypothetical protein [Burkholderiaceae bacterium]
MGLPVAPELPSLADLRVRYRQQLTSASYIGLAAYGLHLGDASGWKLCLVLIAAIGFLAGASTYRRARAIADIATSRIGSAAQGYAEVMGRARADLNEMIVSPYSGISCIWYRYRVYSKETARDEWRQIDSGSSSATFELSDGTGSCRVDPDHAEVMSPERRVSYRDGDKLVEEMLFAGSLIYVLGEFTTVHGAQAALSVSEDVNALLASWKQDPVQLKRRFDLDGNGEIDLNEWALARRLAIKTVEQQHRQLRNLGELNIVRAPADGRMFLISALPPHTLRRRYLWWSAFHLGVALLGLGVLFCFKRPL